MKDDHRAEADLPESAARMIGRFFFATHGVAGIACAVLVAASSSALAPALRLAAVGGVALFAALCFAAQRASAAPRFALQAAMRAVAIAAILLTGAVSALLGDGLRGAPIAFCGLIVFAVGAVGGVRTSAWIGAFAMAVVGALAGAESVGWIRGLRGSMPLEGVLAYQWLLVMCGAIGGGLLSRLLERYLEAAADREQRFRGLLRIAADWYWEQDAQFRFTHLSSANPGPGVSTAAHRGRIGRTPWEIPELGLTAAQLDAHRADLEAHRAFSGLLARRRDREGRLRTFDISGEPQFDTAGVFTGYWGVARDVTAELRTQRAVTASETRYRELFTRSPSPLFLHRRGTVFDANEAAARLFGFTNAAAMNGFDIVGLFSAGPARERAIERIARLESMPVGEGVAVTEHAMRALDGRQISVQMTGVRVETASGAANLSIVFDITARKAAEGALRRSEAMLTHLFATSPDCITLTEIETGRYAMVNAAFTRLTGYGADEVLGRTAHEINLWHDPSTRDHLLARLERDGKVVDLPAEFISRSGERISALLSAGRFVMDKHVYLVLNAHDVTASERTRLQHAAILERASIGIAFTRDGRFVQANPFFERMFGWAGDALVGRSGEVVWPDADDYREIGELAGPPLARGRPFETERRMRRRDGSLFWCRLLAQVVDRNDPSRGGTIWIAEDVTERRRLDEALAAARDAAEAASRAKSAFLANTSHEIRTPLNGLLGLTRLALAPGLPDARRLQYLAQILESAEGLAGIMSDILDVSRIEAGKLVLDEAPFDLRETLAAVHHAHESFARAKGLALELVVDENLPTHVSGDLVRVRQILSNFVNNALKFTERGAVRVEAVRSVSGALRLAVTDTGPGMATETQGRLFTPFSQGDSSTTRRFGGTGLGLSICRELAQMMGGAVGVQSSPGQGSTFWAELPLPDAASVPRALDTEHSELARDLERLLGAHVLMAEDNPVNMMIAVAMLEHWGVRVTQVADGRAAVEAVHAAVQRGEPFDLVVMDVQMPVMGGHEATRELRRHHPPAELPILALTAAALVSERDEALAAGMDAFLTKPIDATKLRQTLAGLVRRQRAAKVG